MGLLDLLRKRKHLPSGRCAAVVAAAGSSTRMGTDKLLMPLNEVPVILRTLRALENCPSIGEIIVVTREDLIVPLGQLCQEGGLSKVSKIVLGGADRLSSVLAGLQEVPEEYGLVAIHDGARPLVTVELVETVIAKGEEMGAAAPAVPVKDTIKRASHGLVTETPDRSTLFAVQTPQVFDRDLLLGALELARTDGAAITDDCSAVERLGMSVALTQGSYENIKLTTPEDVLLAEAILLRREET